MLDYLLDVRVIGDDTKVIIALPIVNVDILVGCVASFELHKNVLDIGLNLDLIQETLEQIQIDL